MSNESSLHAPMGPDFFGLPTPNTADIQVFQTGGCWQTWTKPRGRTMGLFYCIGSGSGGGGGHTATTGNARGGGGGGGGGALSRLLIPLMFVPNTLYCYVGQGGAGGIATNDGTAGQRSYISTGLGATGLMSNLTTAPYIWLVSGTAAATLGAKGTAATGGAAGAGETLATASLTPPAYIGIWTAIVGPAGGVGGAQTGAAGTAAVGIWTTASYLPWTGGGGGGGVTTASTGFAGGGVTASGPMALNAGGAGSAAARGDGGGGMSFMNPMMFCGGSGGGCCDSLTGGNGGNGGIASGGGGGGGGTTGGRGGDGGNGLIVIICW